MARRHDQACAVSILVGERETPPFHQQADDFARHLRTQGLEVRDVLLDDRNHMDSVRDLGIAGTQAADCLMKTIVSTSYGSGEPPDRRIR
jgi:arylformamidase